VATFDTSHSDTDSTQSVAASVEELPDTEGTHSRTQCRKTVDWTALPIYISAFISVFNDSEEINRAWENIKENIKASAKESLKSVRREVA